MDTGIHAIIAAQHIKDRMDRATGERAAREARPRRRRRPVRLTLARLIHSVDRRYADRSEGPSVQLH